MIINYDVEFGFLLLLVCTAEACKGFGQCGRITAQLQRNIQRLVQQQLEVPYAGAHSAAAALHNAYRDTRHMERVADPHPPTCSNSQRSPGRRATAEAPAH